MIIDVFYQTDEAVSVPRYTWRQGGIQAIATSLDAMAVGVGLAFLQVNIIATAFAVGISLRAAYVPLGTACPIIALVTFACCGISMLLGERFASFLGNKATILGGLLLIAIGIKALWP